MLDREKDIGTIQMKGVLIHIRACPSLPSGHGIMFDTRLFDKWVDSMRLRNLEDGTMVVEMPPVPDDLAASAVLVTDVWSGKVENNAR